MLRNLFIKEWKERLPIFVFGLAVLLVFTGLFLGLAQKKEALVFLTGAVTLVFLPVLGLLLGSSGFISEFKDDAWAYLFSRPVKKQQIWLAKYISLLSILLAVAVVLALIVEIVPGVKDVLADLSFTLGLGRQFSLFTLGLICSLIFLTTSFALAIFSDRPHIIVFLALLLWLPPYAVFVLVYSPSLQVWLYRVSVFGALCAVGLFCLSLALASVLTFSRADFSQPRKKAWHFTKLAAALIAASLVISAGILTALSGARRLSRISGLNISEGAAYFHSGKGIYRYDLESRRLQRIYKTASLWAPLSVGGSRIVFVKEVLRGRNRMSEELWTIDTDGKNPEPLVETSRKEGPFYDLLIWDAEVSSGGRTVAFLARDLRLRHTFHWMNSDGSGIQSLPLDMPQVRFLRLAGFSGSAEYVLLQCIHETRAAESAASLLKIDLIQGKAETLAINVRKPHLAGISGKDLAAYIVFDETKGQEVLFLQDLQTGGKTEVLAADSILFGRTGAGDKLAIWAGKAELSIYSLTEGRIIVQRDMKGYDAGVPLAARGRAASETGWILCRSEQGRKVISVVDDRLNEVRAIPLPWAADYGLRLEACGKVVFAWQYDQAKVWTLDLDTAEWRRIY
jgi:hypothetical protein